MPVYQLGADLAFPHPEQADPSGLLAVGGDLSPERLLLAYSIGVFPWYSDGEPILWHSPDPREVLVPAAIRVPRSARRLLRRGAYRVTFDSAFGEVIRACAAAARPDQDGTWITGEMISAYEELFRRGFAHSAEAWQDGELVGGLYGVSMGGAFFGESMFAARPDASKVAFCQLVAQLERWDFDLIDCQVHTEHLERFGSESWPRREFLDRLARSLERKTRLGPWSLTAAPGHPADSCTANPEE